MADGWNLRFSQSLLFAANLNKSFLLIGYGPARKNPDAAYAAWRVYVQERARRGDLSRQGKESSLASAVVFSGCSAGKCQDRIADARGGGHRLHPGGQRGRGAGA